MLLFPFSQNLMLRHNGTMFNLKFQLTMVLSDSTIWKFTSPSSSNGFQPESEPLYE